MEVVFLEGLALQASLIFALGAQNLFVLDSGLNRRYPLVISFTCFLCDLALIMLGVAGSATVLNQFHQLKVLVGMLGVCSLVLYGWGKLLSGSSPVPVAEVRPLNGIKQAILLSFTFSVLNPHAYIDAFVLIGGFSSKYQELSKRIMVGLGAATFSLLWFVLLSYASGVMKPLLEHPRRMRAFSMLSGAALIFLAGKLSTEVYSWAVQIANDPHCTLLGPCSPGILPEISSLR
jgi:L-lysine exporter family protein LysE/ArgO